MTEGWRETSVTDSAPSTSTSTSPHCHTVTSPPVPSDTGLGAPPSSRAVCNFSYQLIVPYCFQQRWAKCQEYRKSILQLWNCVLNNILTKQYTYCNWKKKPENPKNDQNVFEALGSLALHPKNCQYVIDAYCNSNIFWINDLLLLPYGYLPY